MSPALFILYLGSGPGAPNYPIQVWDSRTHSIHSFRLPVQGVPAYVSAAGPNEEIAAIIQTGDRAALVVCDVNGNRPASELLVANRTGLYCPILSHSGKRLAYSITPGRPYPPRANASALIRIMELVGDIWQPLSSEILAALAPFAWGKSENELIIQKQDGSLVSTSVVGSHSERLISPHGRLPATAFDGRGICYLEGSDLAVQRASELLRFHVPDGVARLCWTPDGDSVVLARSSGVYRAAVYELDIKSGNSKQLFETARVLSLDAITQLPGWNAFSSETAPRSFPAAAVR